MLIMNILIVSPYPPPIGGNSVHVQRLSSLLTASGHFVRVLDYKRRSKSSQPNVIALSSNPLIKVIDIFALKNSLHQATLIHFHVSALGRFKWAAPFLVLLFHNFPKVITIHSGSFTVKMANAFWRSYLQYLLAQFQHIITVNEEQAQYLLKLGIANEKVTTIPAFLPQQSNPEVLPHIIKNISEDKLLVLTSGYLTPIYNYDILIDCFTQLDKSRYIFIFACYNETDIAYEQHIYERLAEYPNVIILRDQPPEVFVTIQERCDIYVRTTITDGDSVAIREALQSRKTIFATDCVKRPQGCHLFSSSIELLELFQKHADGTLISELSANISPAFFENILSVYQSALNVRGQSSILK